MKTSNPTRKNRTTAISRVCVLIALTGVATLTNINADEPGKRINISESREKSQQAPASIQDVGSRETFNSADFSVSNEYRDYPQEVRDRLLEYRLNIALQDANESKPEIEPWMMDPSHWDKVLRTADVDKNTEPVGEDNTDDTGESLSKQEIQILLVEYRLSVAMEEEAEPATEIEAWMVDNSHWNSVSELALTEAIQVDSEPEYKLEGWMLNVQSFSENRHFADK